MTTIDNTTALTNEPKALTFSAILRQARDEGSKAHLGQGALPRLAVLVAQGAIDGAIDLYPATTTVASGGNKPGKQKSGDGIDEIFTEYLRSQVGYKFEPDQNGKKNWNDEAKTISSQKQQVSKLRAFAKVGVHTVGKFGKEGAEVLGMARDLYAEHVRACTKAGKKPVSNEYDFLCSVARLQQPSKDVLKGAKNKASVTVEPLTEDAIRGLLQPKEKVERDVFEKLAKMASEAKKLVETFETMREADYSSVSDTIDAAAGRLLDALAEAKTITDAIAQNSDDGFDDVEAAE